VKISGVLNMDRKLLFSLSIVITLLLLINGVSVYASAATDYHGLIIIEYRAGRHRKYVKARGMFTVSLGDEVSISSEYGEAVLNIVSIRHSHKTIMYFVYGSGVFMGHETPLKGIIIIHKGRISIHLGYKHHDSATSIVFRGVSSS